jgi:hypothetical protein
MKESILTAYQSAALSRVQNDPSLKLARHPEIYQTSDLYPAHELRMNIAGWADTMVTLGADAMTLQTAGFEFQNADAETGSRVLLFGNKNIDGVLHAPHMVFELPQRVLREDDIQGLNHRLRTLSAFMLQERRATPITGRLRQSQLLGRAVSVLETAKAERIARQHADWQPISAATLHVPPTIN